MALSSLVSLTGGEGERRPFRPTAECGFLRKGSRARFPLTPSGPGRSLTPDMATAIGQFNVSGLIDNRIELTQWT